jgi:Domain of unknown function (DUF4249)
MRHVSYIIAGVFSVMLLTDCTDPYDPPVVSTNHSYLVVEGFINNGADSTVFTLSHTYPISDSAEAVPELGAKLTVEGTDNSVYPLGETGNGNYGAALSLNNAVQYRLHIVTQAAKQYRSAFVPLKTSPPIDSINWALTGGGLQIYANTHDPAAASTYYLWNYSETWEYHSIYFSEETYLSKLDTVIYNPNDSVYICWSSDQSTNILLGSSASLAHDVIYEAPLVLIPLNSWEIGVEYSIQVKQYVLTPDGYNFWLNMQKNTEQIGSIFSPQPSEIGGNIHNIADSTEQVIGFVSAGTLQKQRIFITPSQIPNWVVEEYSNSCFTKSIPGEKDSLTFYLSGRSTSRFVPTYMDPSDPLPPYRYFIAADYCVDCTLIGGVNQKPSFWP